MIEYDYLIERDEGDEKVTYKPANIPKKLTNLVRIEGPNSSGKSTLLNILALAFHGHNLDRMNPSLKSKMKSLVDSGHQNLQFEVKITEADGALALKSVKNAKNSPEIVVKEIVDGKETTLIPESFHRKYNLIYDIPDDPTERLGQLILEIREVQRIYGMRIGAFRNYVGQTIDQIKNSRDPKRIEELRSQIKDQESTLKTKKIEAERSEKLLSELEDYTFARILCDRLSQKDAAEQRYQEFKKKTSKVEKTARRRDTKYNKKRDEVRSEIEDIRRLHREIGSIIRPVIPKDEKHHLSIWESISFDYVIREYEFNPSFKREIGTFKTILEKLLAGDAKQKMLEARVFSELIEFLGRFRDSHVILPGLEKNIDDFIDILEETNRENKKYKEILETIEAALSKLDEIEEIRKQVLLDFVELKKLGGHESDDGDSYDDKMSFKDQLKDLKTVLDEVTESYNFYVAECAKRGITVENARDRISQCEKSQAMAIYLDYSDKALEAAIDSGRETVSRQKRMIENLNTSLQFNKVELERLEKQEPHKYQKHFSYLEELYRRAQMLENRLNRQFVGYIDSVSGKTGAVSKSDEERRYFQAVSRFLGRKLGHIRHLDRQYRVRRVDLLSKTIITEEDKLIRFSDMGTGQSQSAYLMGLLNATDNRKMIALFDEVAMMDSKSMQPILDRMRDLHNRGRLLAGVVVQRADSVNVVPMV